MVAHTDTTLAYLAGAIDSDGCITIVRLTNDMRSGRGRVPSLHEQVSLKQMTPEVPDLLKKTLGGWRWDKPAKGKHRQMYEWRTECDGAVRAAARLLPYLKIKRQQAELLLEMASLKRQPRGDRLAKSVRNRWGGVTKREYAVLSNVQLRERESLRATIKGLNANGNNNRRARLI